VNSGVVDATRPQIVIYVWAWKENPKGAFVNWHPNVSCSSFAGK